MYICRVYVFVLKVLCGLFDVNVSPAITLWCFNFWICRTSINCPVFHVKEKGSPLREFNISLSQKGSPHIRYVLFFQSQKGSPHWIPFFFKVAEYFSTLDFSVGNKRHTMRQSRTTLNDKNCFIEKISQSPHFCFKWY